MNIKEATKEIRQSRSKFQLEKFVIGQHDTAEMQYVQTCIEANNLLKNIEKNKLEIKKIEAECEELLETGKKSDAIESEIKKLTIEELEDSIHSSQRELDILEEIFEKFPKYTRQQIEDAQEEYWSKRLIRVGQMQRLAAGTGVNWAQIESIYQAGLLPVAKNTLNDLQMLEHEPELLFPTEENKE